MQKNLFIPSTQFIDSLPEICTKLDLVSIYDNGCYSANEMLYAIAQKLNDTIGNMQHNDESIMINLKDVHQKLDYLLGQGLTNEVTKLLNEWYNNGKLSQILEVVMVGFTLKVDKLNDKIDKNLKNMSIVNTEEIKNEGVNYGLDLANYVGQGLFPKGSPENNRFRSAVIHNYVDTEVLTLDNVGEMPGLFIRNARNPQRRKDKPSNYIPQGNFLQFQQGVMDKNNDGSEKDTHSFVTMFNMDYLGNLYWRDTRDEVTSVKLQTVSEKLSEKTFAFVIGAYYNTRYIADFQYSNNKSALKISMDTTGNTNILTQLNGLKITAFKGNNIIESNEGSVVLKASQGVFNNVGGTNFPMSQFVNKPSSPTSNGNKGDYFADSLNLYVCYNPNQWIKLDKVNW